MSPFDDEAVRLWIYRSAQPLRILVGPIKIVAGLEEFELALSGRRGGFGEQSRDFRLSHRFEGSRRFKRLVQALQTVTAVDHN